MIYHEDNAFNLFWRLNFDGSQCKKFSLSLTTNYFQCSSNEQKISEIDIGIVAVFLQQSQLRKIVIRYLGKNQVIKLS